MSTMGMHRDSKQIARLHINYYALINDVESQKLQTLFDWIFFFSVEPINSHPASFFA